MGAEKIDKFFFHSCNPFIYLIHLAFISFTFIHSFNFEKAKVILSDV